MPVCNVNSIFFYVVFYALILLSNHLYLEDDAIKASYLIPLLYLLCKCNFVLIHQSKDIVLTKRSKFFSSELTPY